MVRLVKMRTSPAENFSVFQVLPNLLADFFGHVIWRKRVFNRKVMDSFKKVTERLRYKIKHNIVLFINVVNPRMPKFENLVIITTC